MKRHRASLWSVAARVAVLSAVCLTTIHYARSQAAAPPKDDQGASLLPDGAGKQLIVAKCLACHTAKVIVSQRGTQQDWNETMDKMITNGANVTDDEADKIVAYLTAHFGPPTAPSGAAAPSGGSQTAPASPPPSSTAP